jgi:hypothetical protein
MANDDRDSEDSSADLATLLSGAAGVTIAPDRMKIVAEFLREVREADAHLQSLDLEGIAPDVVFDPSWPEAER